MKSVDRISFAGMNFIRKFLFGNLRLFVRIADIYGLRHGCRVLYDKDFLTVQKGEKQIRIAHTHAPYTRDVIRQFYYYFGSVESRLEGTKKIADFSRPGFHRIPKLGIEFFFNSLPEATDSNEAYLTCFRIKNGDVVIDAGAYCGLTSYLFSQYAGDEGMVIAIEADHVNFQALQKNIMHHSCERITCIEAALWNSPGYLSFASEGNMASSVAGVGHRQKHLIKVPAITLDQLAADLNLEKVDHVKMDIEGSEYQVLSTAVNFIQKFRPSFVIEVHQNREGVVDTKTIEHIFLEQNYIVRKVKQADTEILPLLHCVPQEKASLLSIGKAA